MIRNENINGLVKKFYENKMSHIFLVETNNKNKALEDLLQVIQVINCEEKYEDQCTKCNLCHLIENQTLPSLKIIEADGQNIKKEQMEDLKNAFASIPYFSKYNTYVIKDAENFNNSSANTMLKFIEEPEGNIIGFLITDNKENVINTIKSRCEIVKAFYQEENVQSDERITSLAIDYLKKIEIDQNLSIVANLDILKEKLERKEMILFFKSILDIYLHLLNKSEIPKELEELKCFSSAKILKRIQLVTEILERLNYNVNIQMLMDSFVLEVEEQ